MRCEERIRLQQEYGAATHEFTLSVGRMKDIESPSEFHRAFEQADAAREKYAEARNALEEHRAEHGC
jgi:hypothetical protein